MATELSDPHFCPPRQVRQGQGRGSVFEILSKQGALRFKHGSAKINSSQSLNERTCEQKGVVIREASFNSQRQRSQHAVRRTPSFPVYCPDGSVESVASEKTMGAETSEPDNLTDQNGGQCSGGAIIEAVGGEKNSNKRPPSGREVHEKFPSWPETHFPGTKCTLSEQKKEKHRSRGTPETFGNPETTERSQSWIWNQDELVQSGAAGLCSRISEKKPSQDSGIVMTCSPEKLPAQSTQATEVASTRIFHARAASCDENERNRDTVKNPVFAAGEDDSAWFGSGVDGEISILQEGLLGLQSDNTSPSPPSPSRRDKMTDLSESTSSSDRSSIMTGSSRTSQMGEISREFQGGDQIARAAADDGDSMRSVAPKFPAGHPEYDSETLRRAAAKNREVSKKLFSRLQQQQNLRTGSPRHERQNSGLSAAGSSESGESPRNKRSVATSPSAASSIYAESSSGSSGIGTLTQSVCSRSLTKELYASSPVIQRSTSSETVNPHPPSMDSSLGTEWNTPQQRRNILSMVEQGDTDYLAIAAAQEQAHVSEFATPSHRTSSSAAASRGVSRKISSRKRAAREELECIRSMPDLSKKEEHPQDTSLRVKCEPLSGSEDYFATDGTSFELQNSSRFTAQGGSRSSPIYAVPSKPQRSSDSLSRDSASSSSTTKLELMMKSPPPLPRKPPPPLSDLMDCSPSLPSSNKYSSTPCLYIQSNGSSGMNQESGSSVLWPKSVQSRLIAPPEPQSALPVASAPNYNYSSPNMAMSSGGKPTVEVHPMLQNENNGTLTVNVDVNPGNGSRKQLPGLSSATPSPRPPVPKKPEFLSPRPTAPNPQPPVMRNGMNTTGNGVMDSPRRQEQLNSLEDRCTRLSQFVREKDESLANILQPNHVSSVDCLGDQLAGVHLTNGHGEPSEETMNHSRSISPNSAYYMTSTSKAKFLVGIYSGSMSPGLTNVKRESVDGYDPFELERKKLELIGSLSRKLKILEEEDKAIKEELEMNEKLGLTIQEWLHASSATEVQRQKFRLHVDETQKITCLLLSLSGQIARVENAVNKLPGDAGHSEKALLLERRGRLLTQREDAKGLKESVERRGEQVQLFLRELLSEDQLGDYQYFIQMKRKLLVDAREIEDKIKLGMEQKEALENSLHNGAAANSFITHSTSSLLR